MIKTYRKVATIQAEQFDGSLGMVATYDIKFKNDKSTPNEFRPLKFYIDTLEGGLEIHKGDWIATGVDGEHWAIKDDIFKKSYVEVK